MAFRNAQVARIYVGALRASAYARTGSATSPTDMHDVSVLEDTAKEYIVGQNTSTFTAAGPLDGSGATDGQADLLATFKAASSPTPITFMPLGTDGAAWLMAGLATSFDGTTGTAQSVDWSLSAQTDGATDQNGLLIENNTTVTADTDGTALNNGAGTTQGAAFHLHVTAFSGFTSDDIIVEGSTTGSFGGEETTIATFTQVTALTSERVVVTGTVPRYLRVVDDVTGTGSITRTVAVSRR